MAHLMGLPSWRSGYWNAWRERSRREDFQCLSYRHRRAWWAPAADCDIGTCSPPPTAIPTSRWRPPSIALLYVMRGDIAGTKLPRNSNTASAFCHKSVYRNVSEATADRENIGNREFHLMNSAP